MHKFKDSKIIIIIILPTGNNLEKYITNSLKLFNLLALIVKMALGFTNKSPSHLKFEAESTIMSSCSSILKIRPKDRLC